MTSCKGTSHVFFKFFNLLPKPQLFGCLLNLAKLSETLKITNLALLNLGCGIGHLNWNYVTQLVH